MPSSTIRSRYQRRILDWLLDGGGTVSQAANSLGIAMPHASLAMRHLREAGEVQRDDGASIRGAVHRLTERGAQRLLMDLVGRLKKHTRQIPEGTNAVVLSSDGTSIVLGILQSPESRLFQLPRRTELMKSNTGEISIGKEGGLWAVQRGEKIHWFDLDNFESTSPPPETQEGTLTAWVNRDERVGVLRLRLLEQFEAWNVPDGAWIELNVRSETGPSQLRLGEHDIGLVQGTSYQVSPERGLYAHLPSAVDRNLLVSSLGDRAQLMTESIAYAQDRSLPVDLVSTWMRRRHPRLSNVKRNARVRSLKRWLLSGRGQQPNLHLRRSLLADFGDRNWSEQSEAVDVILLEGVSQNGAACIIEWLLESTTLDCIVEWPWAGANEQHLLDRLLASGRCRALITSRGEPLNLSSKTSTLHGTPQLAVVSYRLHNLLELNIQLDRSNVRTEPEASRQLLPQTAVELLDWHRSGGMNERILTDIAQEEPQYVALVRKAMRLYPNGDSTFSNSIERINPLASWIASPMKERNSRWQRLHTILPQGWVDLLDPQSMDIKSLINGMARTSSEWKERAFSVLALRLSNENSLLLDVAKMLEDSSCGSIAAHLILITSPYFDEEIDMLLSDASLVWLDAPYRPEDVLMVLFPPSLEFSNARKLLFEQYLKAGQVHPRGSILWAWSNAVIRMRENAPLSLDLIRSCMNVLPSQWWSAWAFDWLGLQLSTSSGREWLATHPLSWPSLLARPKGERVGMPGIPRIHSGFIPNQELMINLLMVPEGEGKAALMDVYDMIQSLEAERPVHQGRIHPLVGWLAKEASVWPIFSSDELFQGDSEVSALLIGRAMIQRIDS